MEVASQIYRGKIVLAKNGRSSINTSQRRRSWMLKKTAGDFMRTLKVADGRSYSFGGTELRFSDPVFHGERNTHLGWVLMLTIEREGEKVIHASDVQGPIMDQTLEAILTEEPELVIVGGPPLYLSGFRVSEETIKHGISNLVRLVEKVQVVILEHHILRDENWRKVAEPIFKTAEETGHKVMTAAEFVGKPNNFLEFSRRRLYETRPPTEEFRQWLRFPRLKQKRIKPPLSH
jgi:predicted metallo-beta-lactamase superfamily hydrolase